MSEQIGGLLAVLVDQPKMSGALCTELPRLFDWDLMDDEVEPRNARIERHRQAVDICAVCPAFTRCEEWAATLRAGEVPGVIAGRVYSPKGLKPATRRTAA